MPRRPWVLAVLLTTSVVALSAVAVAQPRSAGQSPVIELMSAAEAMPSLDLQAPHAAPAPPAPAAVLDAAAAGTVTQTISVRIAPGPLLLIDPPRTIHLRRLGTSSRFEATVTGLRLVDARGSHVGWQLRMQLVRMTGGADEYGELHVVVRRIQGLADSVEGITAADPFDLAAGTSAVLATAAPASGAGTWDVTLDVSADLPDVRAGVVIARVQFDVV